MIDNRRSVPRAPLSVDQVNRIKAATRDLVSRAGGLDRVATLTGWSRTQVHNWGAPPQQSLIPLDALILLECDSGDPIVTRCLAALAGYQLDAEQPAPRRRQDTVAGHLSDFSRSSGRLVGALAEATASRRITPNEAARLDRHAADVERKLQALRLFLSGETAGGSSC